MTKQIPQGYKQTKLGVIPEDWEVVKLNEKSVIQRGRFSPRPRNDPQYYNGNYPFVQTNDVVNSKGKITNYSQTLNEKGLKVSKIFPKGTILMTIAANIGFTGILTIDMTCPDSLVGIKCKKDLYNKYLNFYFMFNQKRIDYLAEEAAQKNINLSTLNVLNIPFPPLKEQEKIAEILSTWDDVITKQEQLIEQKQVFKKGIMQQIFSQKVRFKDDNGNDYPAWQSKKLSGITNITIGEFIIKTKQNPNGLYPVFNGGVYCTGFYDEFNNEGNKIIISARGANAGYVNFEKRRYWAGNSCYSVDIVDKKLYIINYFHYYIKFNQNKFVDNQQAANIPSVSKKDVQNFRIMLPNFAEQTKIANFLTNIDEEITKQSEILDQLKLQKQSLMQKLLTGQVRVKI
jgi:type I restriction enzyme S subunit